MKRIRLGEPEKIVPSAFCDNFNYSETSISYPLSRITAKDTPRGFLVEFPIEDDAHIYGFGLQLKQFDHRGRKLKLSVNADPVSNNGDSHAPVPFFATKQGLRYVFRHREIYRSLLRLQEKDRSTGKSRGKERRQDLNRRALRHPRPERAVMSVLIPAAHGIDIYIMEGKNITDVVSQYNMLSGGGCDVPEWALGVLYRCCGRYSQDEVMAMADYYRKSDIPVRHSRT